MAKSALIIIRAYYPGVTLVSDARKSVTLRVSKEDCAKANSKQPSACALARACKREYDGAIISLSVAYLISGNKALRFKVPESVSREIISFDRNHNFSPGEYTLKAPSASTRLGPRRHPQPKDKGVYVRIKRRNHKTSGLRSL